MSLLLIFIIGGYNLGVEPPTVELVLSEPGKVYYGFLTLYNRGKSGYYVKLGHYDFGIDQNDGSPLPVPLGSTPYSMRGWLKFEPESLYLAPMKAVKVRYTLNPPSGAMGSYYGMVLVSTISPGTEQFRTGIDIGVNFLVTVGNNKLIKKAKIESFYYYKSKEDIQFAYKVSNIGETHLRIKTFLEIKDKQGKVLKRYEPSQHTFLPPQTNRLFQFTWQRPQKGEYTAFAFITYEDEYEIKETKFAVK
uniref:Uncharacterized protein n=1 Tax=candidate division WOR-3 bacterium TaxID=2052148 RepID=A0A7C4XVR6_UNCW3